VASADVAPSQSAAASTATAKSTEPNASASVESKADVYTIVEVRRESIPFKKVIQLSRNEDAGQAQIETEGQPGIVEKTYRVTYRGNDPAAFDLIHTQVIKQPVDTIILAGYTERGARALPSHSGTYTRTREIDMIATGYSPYEGSSRGLCATGIRAGFGVVAVDPNVIPLGSKLYIDGYGYALAGDTGGAIHGNRIDLGLNSYRQADNVGRRVVHVYVMSEGR
jgi:3D (Asp-Asp-Asp) domain-containing protein